MIVQNIHANIAGINVIPCIRGYYVSARCEELHANSSTRDLPATNNHFGTVPER